MSHLNTEYFQHELLDRLFIQSEHVETLLLNHESISDITNPAFTTEQRQQLLDLITKAHKKLRKAYKLVARIHL